MWVNQMTKETEINPQRLHTKSHEVQDLGKKQSFERILGHIHLMILESLREAGGNQSSVWGERHWRQPFGGALSTTKAVENLSAMQETQVRSLGREDPLQKEMATHSSILAWRIPRMEKPG